MSTFIKPAPSAADGRPAYSVGLTGDLDASGLLGLDSAIGALALQFPDGVTFRLHATGDFPSLAYVERWAMVLRDYPQVSVIGHTAIRSDDADPERARIGRAIACLTGGAWSRFQVRTGKAGVMQPQAPGAKPADLWRRLVADLPALYEERGGVSAEFLAERYGARPERIRAAIRTAGAARVKWVASGQGGRRLLVPASVKGVDLRARKAEAEAAPAGKVVDVEARARQRDLVQPFTMQRTDRDRRPPSAVMTPRLMGDPAPDRLERAEAARRRAFKDEVAQ